MARETYPLTYTVRREDPPIARDQLNSGERGAADAIILLSMMYPEDGSFGLVITSLDGRTGEEVTDKELWKVWAMMAYRLAQSRTLSEPKRSLAQTLHECVATALAASGERSR